MQIKPLFYALTLSISLLATPVFANSENSANPSADISIAAGSIIVGSALLLSASGELVVESIEKVGNGVVFVLKNMSQDASKASKVSVQLSGNVAGAASVVAGQSVEVLAESTGAAIMASGKLIAFIPNEIGNSLIYHQEIH